MRLRVCVLPCAFFLSGCGGDLVVNEADEPAKCDGELQSSEEYLDDQWDRDGDGAVFGSVCLDNGYTEAELDCDDDDSAVSPRADEITCDGIDNDCSSDTPDNADADGDGYGLCDGDCDDTEAGRHPGLSEVTCNGIDDDCDDSTADDSDADGDGYGLCDGDCDDTEAGIHPDAEEICNDGIDQNCVDDAELCAEMGHVDLSAPGHGAALYGAYSEDVLIYDLDADGHLDVLTTYAWSGYQVSAALGPIMPGDQIDLRDVIVFDDDDASTDDGPLQGFALGDLDGDGDLPDLIVSRRDKVHDDGAPRGGAWIFFDFADDTTVASSDRGGTVFLGSAGSGSGWAQNLLQPRVADVTGDGSDDVIIGWNNGYDGVGAGAFLYPGPIRYGADHDISDAEVVLKTGAYAGGTVGAVDDFSGDGVADVYAAAPYTLPGAVYLLDATASGLGIVDSDDADTALLGEGTAAYFGGHYGAWVDNVDAVEDSDLGGALLAVGAPGRDPVWWAGAAYVFEHTAWGTEADADTARLVVEGDDDEALFLGCEVLLGDFTNDGSIDLLTANCDASGYAVSEEHAWIIPGPLPEGRYAIDDPNLDAVRWDGAAYFADAGDLNEDGRLDLAFGLTSFRLGDGSAADGQHGVSVIFASGE